MAVKQLDRNRSDRMHGPVNSTNVIQNLRRKYGSIDNIGGRNPSSQQVLIDNRDHTISMPGLAHTMELRLKTDGMAMKKKTRVPAIGMTLAKLQLSNLTRISQLDRHKRQRRVIHLISIIFIQIQ